MTIAAIAATSGGSGWGFSGSDFGLASGYAGKVLNTSSANLIAYWTLGEASGSTATDLSGNSRDGAYTAVTLGQTGIGDGRTAPLFDASTSFCDIYSTSLRDAFDGDEGTLSIWMRVADADVWTDSTARDVVNLRVDANNIVRINRSATDNVIAFTYRAGGTTEARNSTIGPSTDWMQFGITWSADDDEVIYYLNGSAVETDTALGTWAGTLASTNTIVGAFQTTPSGVFDGYTAHVAIWAGAGAGVLTSAQMAVIGVV